MTTHRRIARFSIAALVPAGVAGSRPAFTANWDSGWHRTVRVPDPNDWTLGSPNSSAYANYARGGPTALGENVGQRVLSSRDCK